MIIAILAFWLGYKRGAASGRNGALWSIICGFSFLGTQIVMGLVLGLTVAIGSELWGWNERVLDEKPWIALLLAVVPSFLVLFGLIWWLERYPKIDEAELPDQPPPPPTFGN
ncbi:MAG: hypothetical protein JNL64_02155 [Blastocatellia bacterium]|nr:hypothetical protein [Blastocatellia bacterium]